MRSLNNVKDVERLVGPESIDRSFLDGTAHELYIHFISMYQTAISIILLLSDAGVLEPGTVHSKALATGRGFLRSKLLN